MQVQWLELEPKEGGVLVNKPQLLDLPEHCTVVQALSTLGFNPAKITELLAQRAVAIYGLYATDRTVLYDGDRIEILDSLSFDPMESRRRRAQHKVVTKRQKELARYERRSRRQAKTQA